MLSCTLFFFNKNILIDTMIPHRHTQINTRPYQMHNSGHEKYWQCVFLTNLTKFNDLKSSMTISGSKRTVCSITNRFITAQMNQLILVSKGSHTVRHFSKIYPTGWSGFVLPWRGFFCHKGCPVHYPTYYLAIKY